ncbi:MAG: SurA N-terminal domain-containing protein [Desulfosudaceae bacterium]
MADHYQSRKWFILIFLGLLVWSGCTDSARVERDDFLIRIDGKEITSEMFYDALEIAKTAYPYNTLQNEETVKAIKTRLLKQLTEELILAKRAEELGITVSPAELDEAVDTVREDYPEGAFEAALLENAISLPVWKKRLRIRLLMEKLIEKELVETVTITPEEIMAYYQQRYPDEKIRQERLATVDREVIKHLRREKAQERYPEWIDGIQQQYRVELNSEKWQEILD